MTQITHPPAVTDLSPELPDDVDVASLNRALRGGASALFHQPLWNLGSNPA